MAVIPQSWALISYGGVTFELRGTKTIGQKPEFDARGNYKFTRWTFEFSAVLNPTEQRVFVGIGFAVPIESAAAGAGMSPF